MKFKTDFRFDPLCVSPMAIKDAHKAIDAHGLLHCQSCLLPSGQAGCCDNCFNVEWPGMSYSGTDGAFEGQVAGYLAAATVGLWYYPSGGGVNPAACAYAYTQCEGTRVLLSFENFMGWNEFGSSPPHTGAPVFAVIIHTITYPRVAYYKYVPGTGSCRGADFTLDIARSDFSMGDLTLEWPSTIHIEGAVCGDEHEIPCVGCHRPFPCGPGTFGWPDS